MMPMQSTLTSNLPPLDRSMIPRQPRLVRQAPLAKGVGPAEDDSLVIKKRSSGGGGTGVFFDNAELTTNALKALTASFNKFDTKMRHDVVTDDDDTCIEEAAAVIEEEDMFFSDDLDFSSPLPPSKDMEVMPMPDIELSSAPETDVTTLNKAIGEWKPFLNRVSKFIERGKCPFQYVDVWVLDASSTEDSTSESHVLRHVGHATNPRTEVSSLFTMWHMNQFGEQSEKYVFQPGVGLPGRVLARGEPIWDDKLSNAETFTDFPRTHLARKHGVKKGLGIPLVLPGTIKQAMIVMYTTQENMKPDRAGSLIDMTYEEFQKNTVSLLAPSLMMTGARGAANRRRFSIGEATAIDMDVDEAAAYQAILPSETEVDMAAILRDYAQDNDQPGSTSMELQCLLWRAPCRRTLQQNMQVDALTRKFQAYNRMYQQDHTGGKRLPPPGKDAVARMLALTWDELVSSSGFDSGRIEVLS